jgi:hypothetical protein
MAEKRLLAFTSIDLTSGKETRRGGRKAQARTRKLVEKKTHKRIERSIIIVGGHKATNRKN